MTCTSSVTPNPLGNNITFRLWVGRGEKRFRRRVEV